MAIAPASTAPSDAPPAYDDVAAEPPLHAGADTATAAATQSGAASESKKAKAAASSQAGPLDTAQAASSSSRATAPPPAFSSYVPTVYADGRVRHPYRALQPGLTEDDLQYSPVWLQPAPADVFACDDHLNEDGEALYRFLLKMALIPPKTTLIVRGWHEEQRTSLHHSHNHHHHDRRGHSHHHRVQGESSTDTYTVVDFDFEIDLTPLLKPTMSDAHSRLSNPWQDPTRHVVQDNPTMYVKADKAPAYRGRMVPEYLAPASQVRHRLRARSSARAQAHNNTGNQEDRQALLSDQGYGLETEHDNDVEAGGRLLLVRATRAYRRAMSKAFKQQWLPWTQGIERGTGTSSVCAIHRQLHDAGIQTEHVSLEDDDAAPATVESVKVKVRPAEGPSKTTVRMVCDDFTLSNKELKEFVVKKRVAGWDVPALEEAVKRIVAEVYPARPGHCVVVKFNVASDKVKVVPDNQLSRQVNIFKRVHGFNFFMLMVFLIVTGAFIIVLPAVWILRRIKGARYTTVGVVWQLSQWDTVPEWGSGDVQDERAALALLLAQERDQAAQAGASWALDDRTRCPAEIIDNAAVSTSAHPNAPFSTTACVRDSETLVQQPFVLCRTGTQLLAHRGVRQGDFVRAWEARIKEAVRSGYKKRSELLGSHLRDHVRPENRLDALQGQVDTQLLGHLL